MFGTIDQTNDEANRLFDNFFFSHIALFEGRLERLRLSVEQAYYSGKTQLFLEIMMHVSGIKHNYFHVFMGDMFVL